jgi:hypothetical protein
VQYGVNIFKTAAAEQVDSNSVATITAAQSKASPKTHQFPALAQKVHSAEPN